LSANRGTEPAKLTRLLRGELDWIVMKALEKDRNRRYDSANGFAADVQRFLAGEPVQAVPPSTGYRLRKFVRRNRGSVLAVGTVLVTLVAAVAVSSVLAVIAQRASADARSAEENERGQRTRAEAEWERAETNATSARAATKAALAQRYVSDARLVQWFWSEGQFDLVRELLARQLPERTAGTDFRKFEWYYWHRATQYPQRTIRGVETAPGAAPGTVVTSATSADGSRSALYVEVTDPRTNDVTAFVKIVDLRTGAPGATVPIPVKRSGGIYSGSVLGLALAPDGTRLAGIVQDKTENVRVWDAATGELIWERQKPPGAEALAYRIGFGADGRQLTLSGSKEALVLSAATGDEEKRFPVSAFHALFPDGNRIATCQLSGPPAPGAIGIRVLELATQKELYTIPAPPRTRAFGPAVSADGTRLAFLAGENGTNGGQVIICDAQHGGKVASGKLPDWCLPRTVEFHPDGRTVMVVAEESAHFFDIETGAPRGDIGGWASALSPSPPVRFVGSAGRVVSIGREGTIGIWDEAENRDWRPLRGHRGQPGRVAYSSDGALIVSGGVDRTVRIWDPNGARELAVLHAPAATMRGLAISRDNRRVAAVTGFNSVTTWDLENKRQLATWVGAINTKGLPLPIALALAPLDPNLKTVPMFFGLALAPDGRTVAYAGSGGVHLRETDTGHFIARLDHTKWEPTGHARDVAYSPDGRLLASTCGSQVLVWDVAARTVTTEFKGHESTCLSVAFSPDGTRIATAGHDRTVRVWDVRSGRSVAVLRGHVQCVAAVVWSTDGSRIISAAGNASDGVKTDNTIRVWETESWQDVLVLRGHTDWLTGLAISPDGRRIVSSSSMDGTLRLWDSIPNERPAQ
jgi:WD40 repeat protein